MTSVSLSVPEYGKIFEGNANTRRPDGNLDLDVDEFESVLTLLEEPSTKELHPIFRFSRQNGVNCLQVQNYVGVIRTESGCQIEILPKSSKAEDPQTERELLVKMLVFLRNSPMKHGTVADLRAYEMTLFEMVMRYFLVQVTNVVRQGIARSYVDTQDNLLFLRGKIQLTEHIKHNLIQRTKFYCEFDEFEANRPINRLIKRALNVVHRESGDPINVQHCRELMFWFDRVPPSVDIERDFRSVRHDRLVHHYSPAMPTCRLILESLNPLTQSGNNRTISLLFDMNKVFEDYVVARLTKQFPHLGVNSKIEKHYLVDVFESHKNFKKKERFRLKPDILLYRKDQGARIIADCKWKLLHENISGNFGIMQSDMYQLYAYCQKCLPMQDNRRVFLIYPKTSSFSEPIGPFSFDEETKDRLYVLPFDLQAGRLLYVKDCMLDEPFLDQVA